MLLIVISIYSLGCFFFSVTLFAVGSEGGGLVQKGCTAYIVYTFHILCVIDRNYVSGFADIKAEYPSLRILGERGGGRKD